MKKSELKEAIKNEITSVLTENKRQERYDALNDNEQDVAILNNMTKKYGKDVVLYWLNMFTNENYGSLDEAMSDKERENRIQHLMRTGAKEKPLRKLAAMGKKEDEDSLKEGKKGVVIDPDEIRFHLDQFYGGNIDGNDLANAIDEILSAMMVGQGVPFSKTIREEDEPTDAEIKKADSVASAANKLQKLVKKMKDKAKDFKAAEGEAKEKIKDELKAMTAEKKKLEKSI